MTDKTPAEHVETLREAAERCREILILADIDADDLAEYDAALDEIRAIDRLTAEPAGGVGVSREVLANWFYDRSPTMGIIGGTLKNYAIPWEDATEDQRGDAYDDAESILAILAKLPSVQAAEPFGQYVELNDGTQIFRKTGEPFPPTAQGYKAWTLYATAPQPPEREVGE